VNAFWIKVYKEERTVQNAALEAFLQYACVKQGFHIVNTDLRRRMQQQNFLWWNHSNTRHPLKCFKTRQQLMFIITQR